MDVKKIYKDTSARWGGGVVAIAYASGTDKAIDRINETWFSEFNRNITRKSATQNGNGPGITGRELLDTARSYGNTWLSESRVEYVDRITEESVNNCYEFKTMRDMPANIKNAIYNQYGRDDLRNTITKYIYQERRFGTNFAERPIDSFSKHIDRISDISTCIKETYRTTSAGRTLVKTEITKLTYTNTYESRTGEGNNDDNYHERVLEIVTAIDIVNKTYNKISSRYYIDY